MTTSTPATPQRIYEVCGYASPEYGDVLTYKDIDVNVIYKDDDKHFYDDHRESFLFLVMNPISGNTIRESCKLLTPVK